MEHETKAIINVATIDKWPTSWKSNIMEKEAFIQTVNKLSKEIKIAEICTDARVQIGALLGESSCDIMYECECCEITWGNVK